MVNNFYKVTHVELLTFLEIIIEVLPMISSLNLVWDLPPGNVPSLKNIIEGFL
jgi:hypothetical protein